MGKGNNNGKSSVEKLCFDFRKVNENEIFVVGDIVRLKKSHPCGSAEWEIQRVGADFLLKCMGCGHQIMITRRDFMKSVKSICQNDNTET